MSKEYSLIYLEKENIIKEFTIILEQEKSDLDKLTSRKARRKLLLFFVFTVALIF